jgi:hypothetical protein
MRTYTLEELEHGLQGFTTVSPHQFTIKSAILETLGRLKSMRNQLQSPKFVNNDKFAHELATVLGDVTQQRRS